MKLLDDESPMPYGKYKGEKMANVPANYLLWMFYNQKCNYLVSTYVQENLDVLKLQAKEE
jgi:uncharacterized protein (DUF3820 family)